LLKGRGLVKTIKFRNSTYLGDPRNAVRIYNEKEVDELVILDILATRERRVPDFDLIDEIVSEAFMPVAYGGGIRDISDARRILALGVEKIVICSRAVQNPTFVRELAELFGSQSVVACMDVKRDVWGRLGVYSEGGRTRSRFSPLAFARDMEANGVGEILINSVDRDGTMLGYDVDLVKSITSRVNVPVTACGGAGKLDDCLKVIRDGGASAAAAGSLFVFYGECRAVLISYPNRQDLIELFK
jgi:cyclase